MQLTHIIYHHFMQANSTKCQNLKYVFFGTQLCPTPTATAVYLN